MTNLLQGEKLELNPTDLTQKQILSDDFINEKYVKGEVRIVTEQARYPLNSVPGMVNSNDYNLNPEFQRRHRWGREKQSRLIESFIMNVPIPPIFLYEDQYSHYEVMDGLQRLTAIQEFYSNDFQLEGLSEWSELNGRTYANLPEQVRRGIDRRYLSSIILLQETAKTKEEAELLKQLVFERINSGGVKLEPQETRNAIYNGPLNKLCIRLARNADFCFLWGIPEPTNQELTNGQLPDEVLQNDDFRKMYDVELILRYFAYRQRKELQRGRLRDYLDKYLKFGNAFQSNVLSGLESLFVQTINLVRDVFGENAFFLYRVRNSDWAWYSRRTTTVYDPLMFVMTKHLHCAAKLKENKDRIREDITNFYQLHYEDFEGRNTNMSILSVREKRYEEFLAAYA